MPIALCYWHCGITFSHGTSLHDIYKYRIRSHHLNSDTMISTVTIFVISLLLTSFCFPSHSLNISRETIENYDPNQWDYNGPCAVYRTMQKVCNKTKLVDMMWPEHCLGFKIMPRTAFFPFSVSKPAFDTDEKTVENALKLVTNETIAAHFWNSNTRHKRILKSGKQNAYMILAQKYCPKAYGASGDYFDGDIS